MSLWLEPRTLIFARQASYLGILGSWLSLFPSPRLRRSGGSLCKCIQIEAFVVSHILMSASNSSLPGYTVLTRFHASLPNATFSLTDLSFPKLLYKRLTPARRFFFAQNSMPETLTVDLL